MAEAGALIEDVKAKLGARVLDTLESQGDAIIFLDRTELRTSFRGLRDDGRLRFNFLSDLTAVDYWKKKSRALRSYTTCIRWIAVIGCGSESRFRRVIRPWSP